MTQSDEGNSVLSPSVGAPPAGYGVYADYIKEQLDAQEARKVSLEQRGLAVITTSGVLVTLLFGLTALSARRASTFVIPDTAAALLIVALAFFVLAALCAIFTNLPRSYEAATVDGLRVAVKERWEDYYSPSLNINRINADAVQIAQRDMFISNRGDGLQQIAVIRKAVNSADLPDKRRKQALQELRAAEEETSKPDPDVQKVGDRIEALTRILRDSGALISAGTAVAQALTQLAHWFGGPAGQSVLRLVS